MASRFLVAGGTGNWNSTTNWAATSGGASGASFPVAGDAVTFDTASANANMTVNVASACASLVCTATYAGTLTFDAVLTLTSTLTFVSTMTIAGTAGGLAMSGTSTMTSAGKTMTGSFSITGTFAITLADNWTVNGLVSFPSAAPTMSGNTMSIAGNFTQAGTSIGGTTVLKIVGTSTINSTGTTGCIAPVTIDAGGNTVTITALTIGQTCVLTYVSGTIAAGSALTMGGTNGSRTINTSGMTWASITTANCTMTLTSALHATDIQWVGTPITIAGAFDIDTVTMTTQGSTQAITISSNINCSGLWSESTTTSLGLTGAFAITAGSCTMSGTKTITLNTADVTITGLTTSSDANVINGAAFNWKTAGLTVTGALTGTATMLFNGTGTWQGAAALSMNTTINTAGTLTLSGTVLFAASGTPTLTYTAGTISAGVSILSIASSCTLATVGMTWANVTLSAALTLTLNSLLTVSGTFKMPDAAVTLAGTGGFSVGTFTNTTITATRIWTFQTLVAFIINTAFTTVHAAAQTVRFTITSSSGATRALITLTPGATQDVGFADATRIDSSLGLAIFSYHGVLVDTINWNVVFPTSGGLRAVGNAS